MYQALKTRREEWADAGIRSIRTIGDARAPGALVHAVYSGHEFGREFDPESDRQWLRDQPITGESPGPAYS
jgi:dimethylamine/trimethylamine dehydrogenase